MYTAVHLHGERIAVGHLTIFQCFVSQKTQSESKGGAVISFCDTQNSARSLPAPLQHPPLVWAPWPGFIVALGFHEVSGQAGAAEDVQGSPRLNKQLNSLPLAQNGARSALPKNPNLFKCHIIGAQNALSGNSDTHSGKLSKEKHHVSPPAEFLILF